MAATVARTSVAPGGGGDVPNAPVIGGDGVPSAPGAPAAPGAPMAPTMKMGPQPTKPPITPAHKMRPIHWTRVLITDATMPSIWSTIDNDIKIRNKDTVVIVSHDQIAETFKQKEEKVKEGKSKPEEDDSTDKEIRLIPDKRFNALSIMLNFLPPMDVIVKAIRTLDTNLLNAGQIAAIHKAMPTEEEMKAVTESKALDSQLARPELYIRQLASIPQVSARIDCWHFQLHFKDQLNDVLSPFSILDTAIHAIRHSLQLRRLLGLILQIGNYLNGGTNRGQADGYDLTILSRLNMVKSNISNDLNVLQFVVDIAMQTWGSQIGEQLYQELSPLKIAQDFSLRACTSAATRFAGIIKTQRNLVSLVTASTENSIDPFNSIMSRFFAEAEEACIMIKNVSGKTNAAFTELVFYLNPTLDTSGAARVLSEELCSALVTFAEQVNRAVQYRERERLNAIEAEKEKARKIEMQRLREERARQKAEANAAAAPNASPHK